MGGFTLARGPLGSCTAQSQFNLKSNFPSNDSFLFPNFFRFPCGDGRQTESLKTAATKQDLTLTIPRTNLRHASLGDALNGSLPSVSGFDFDSKSILEKYEKKRSRGSGGRVAGFERRKRMSLDSRTALKKEKLGKIKSSKKRSKDLSEREKIKNQEMELDYWSEEVDRLIAQYTVPLCSGSLDWDNVPKAEVLSASEHDWLTKLTQPLKIYEGQKKKLTRILGREPSESELAKALRLPVRTLRRHLQAGRAAKNMLVERNLRLVLWEAYRQSYSIKELGDVGLQFSDLCNAGLKGLLVALDRFQPGRKLRFSTYAFYWIRYYILQAITKNSGFSLPANIAALRLRMRKERLQFRKLYGRNPTKQELSAKMKLDPEKFMQVWKGLLQPTNLNLENLPGEEEEPLSRWIDNGSLEENSPFDPRLELRRFVDGLLGILTPSENKIIRERYGFDGTGSKTLKEAANALNLSNERIRRGENTALRKLGDPARIERIRQQTNELMGYLDKAEMLV